MAVLPVLVELEASKCGVNDYDSRKLCLEKCFHMKLEGHNYVRGTCKVSIKIYKEKYGGPAFVYGYCWKFIPQHWYV